MNENLYIKRLHQGNEEVFRHIFDKFQTRLNYYAKEFLSEGESSEDVVQDAFVKLWQKKEDFYSLNEIKSFLYIVVKNHCLNIYKHEKVVEKYVDRQRNKKSQETEENAMHYLIEAEVLENLHTAVQKLPPRCQKVMCLSYFEGLKNKEVAKHLDVSVNTVKTQKKRGLQLLKRSLKGATAILFLIIGQIF